MGREKWTACSTGCPEAIRPAAARLSSSLRLRARIARSRTTRRHHNPISARAVSPASPKYHGATPRRKFKLPSRACPPFDRTRIQLICTSLSKPCHSDTEHRPQLRRRAGKRATNPVEPAAISAARSRGRPPAERAQSARARGECLRSQRNRAIISREISSNIASCGASGALS